MEKLENVKNAVVALSGGMDSTTLVYHLVDKLGKENVHAVSFSYGQKQSLELKMATKTCEKIGVKHTMIDISFYGQLVKNVSANIEGTDVDMPTIQDVLGDPQPPTYLPYRNLIFLSLLAAYAESNEVESISIGSQSRDIYSYWDNSVEFIEGLGKVFSYNRQHDVKLIAPFVAMSKADELELGIELGVDYGLTLTCYNPNEKGESCGTCPTCAERIQAFMDKGVKDPVPYSVDIPWVSPSDEEEIILAPATKE